MSIQMNDKEWGLSQPISVTSQSHSEPQNVTKRSQKCDQTVTFQAPIKENNKRKRKGSSKASVHSTEENLQAREVFAAVRGLRDYPSPNSAAEAAAIHWMIKNQYSPAEIVDCYKHLKATSFWSDKHLTLMSVKSQIGAWKARFSGRTSEWDPTMRGQGGEG